ncbi:hypothetical protein [Streptacidiphilus sp. EB129]|uniref:hypothetical protein n=1 Tax=Streptacidiphilus sp. EB129 TaxID=3156262 RepID=UPI0035169EAF
MSSTRIGCAHPGNARVAYTLRAVDPAAMFPHPLPGDPAASHDRHARLDARIRVAALGLGTVQRRARQAASAYRYAAAAIDDDRCATPDADWFAAQSTVCRRRAELAADERAARPEGGTDLSWGRLAAAYAWTALHLDDARHSSREDAAAWLRTAALRLDGATRRPSVSHPRAGRREPPPGDHLPVPHRPGRPEERRNG